MHHHSVNLPVDRSHINPALVNRPSELALAVARRLCSARRRHIPNRLRDPRRGISWGTNHGKVYIPFVVLDDFGIKGGGVFLLWTTGEKLTLGRPLADDERHNQWTNMVSTASLVFTVFLSPLNA